MVFLTVYPEEVEHTKEPAYDRDIRWPPGRHLQSFSIMTPFSEKSKTDDGCSSQDRSDTVKFASSEDTAHLGEGEASQRHSEAMDNADVTIIRPALQQEQPRFEGQVSDTVQTPSTALLPPVDVKHPVSFETLVKPLPSENATAEDEIPVSTNRFCSSGMSSLGEFRACRPKLLAIRRMLALILHFTISRRVLCCYKHSSIDRFPRDYRKVEGF